MSSVFRSLLQTSKRFEKLTAALEETPWILFFRVRGFDS